MLINKKAIFFSTDAFIAILIIISVLLIAFPSIKFTQRDTQIHFDILNTLSSLKVSESDNSFLQTLITQGTINNTNLSMLEQIGELYVTDIELARSLTEAILEDFDTNKNIGIWYGNSLIYSINTTPIETAENIETARQLISGIQEGGSVTGFSARAFLISGLQNKYLYFGGYIGDGNISAQIEYSGNITSGNIELVINNDFTLFINGVNSGSYNASPNEFTPVTYTIPVTNFNSGTNLIEFKGDNLHIAGGFLKITYESASLYEQPTKYYFAGINGLINIYDGFYIPNNLNSLEISLHINTNYSAFLTIGNTTVFKNISQGEESINLTNAYLSTLLNYPDLSKKTIPLRLGLDNVSYSTNTSKESDTFSVTDLSGSMSSGNPTKVSQAISANRLLVDIILNSTGNKIGLVGYDTTAREEWYHNISNDKTSLNNILDIYATGGGTCICCGINRAIRGFNESLEIGTIKSRISQSTDDAEERLTSNSMYLDSSDLELIRDSSTPQEVGMRFQNLNVPQGAIIISAFIEFETDETNSETTHITFSAHNTDNAPTFSSSKGDITNRQKTDTKITWENVPAWNIISEKHITPDISPVIQEVVNRAGWNIGNSIVIIVNGTGRRTAESFNGESDNAPLLTIKFMPLGCGNGVIEGAEQCDDGNTINSDACTNQCKNAICGDNVIWNQVGGTEQCDDGNTLDGDGCSSLCHLEDRLKTMIVMSDGQANRECPEQNTGDAGQDAIKAAQDACNNENITVYAVGFGNDVDETTLQQIPQCGGAYYFGNLGDLSDIYSQIAQTILQAQYVEQTIAAIGNVSTILFPDSYIIFNYTKQTFPYGLIITSEKKFDNNFSGSFSIPENATITETRTTSYSGPKWTDKVNINNKSVYNINNYGQNYVKIGDPYIIYIPNSLVEKDNIINTTTGTSPSNSTYGSEHNKIIYTLVKNATAYSKISPTSQGCIWNIQFEDYTNLTRSLPTSYTGSESCYYQENKQEYNENDASQNSIFELLRLLDLNLNNKVDLKFTEQDLQIDLTEITGIPYTWTTEVQARTWY